MRFHTSVTVEGYVEADNAGDAVHVLSQMVRDGIGPEDKRDGEVAITEGAAKFAPIRTLATDLLEDR